MGCQAITFENHVVEVDGVSMSGAMLAGLESLQWVRREGRSLLRGRMPRQLYDRVMSDPTHRFHPRPCSCKH